jgi:hypothetical protein
MAALIAAATLTGCGTPGAAPTTAIENHPTGALLDNPTVTSSPPSPDARLVVTQVRLSVHDGFDRVVFELSGEGAPGWHVGWAAEARKQATDEPVELKGDGILEVRIIGAAYPSQTPFTAFDGPDLDVPSPNSVTAVTTPLVFEGVAQSFIGVDNAVRAFHVSAQTNPTRLVIDVASSEA